MTLPAGAVVVDDVSKSFRLFHSYSLKESLIRVGRRQPLFGRRQVLRGLSFRVEPGERVALLGRNGAGKSTLFRLLSGILKPDRGSAVVGGRIAPLIEITTGLVPDLTGAENLRLNAAILGLSRAQTDAVYPQIVAFAELEDYMETPVRYYSSGMTTRLGFAIVAHVDADIVFVDEALSVGDVAFQQRCMAKMKALAAAGVTVLYASHDRASVETFCQRALWLDGGTLRLDGDVPTVLAAMRAAEAAAEAGR